MSVIYTDMPGLPFHRYIQSSVIDFKEVVPSLDSNNGRNLSAVNKTSVFFGQNRECAPTSLLSGSVDPGLESSETAHRVILN